MRGRRRIQWLFVPAICGLLGFLFALRQYLLMLQQNNSIPWSQAFFDQLPYWLLWAAVSPVILWLADRIPIQRQRWLTGVAVHVPASALIALMHPVLYLLVSFGLEGWQSSKPPPFTSGAVRQELVFSLIPGVIFYWLILAVSLAFDYYGRYQEERVFALQLRAKLAEAQLQTLKMELHPHFLFNALHSVTALVLKREDRLAVQMISRLSELLRRTLEEAETQEVPLSHELDFLRLYLEIEATRFEDRLKVGMHIEPQTLEALVPNLVLQPLVENAVRHGIAAHSSASRIEIRSWREGEKLCLEVRDDGPGLPWNPNDRQLLEGVGLSNTRARLAHLYGAGSDFSLLNNECGGVSAKIILPYHLAAGSNGNGEKAN